MSAKGLSRNCRFYTAVDDPPERLKAGTELGFLDAHPFPIPGAEPGADVKVLVRLKVSPDKTGKGFDVAAPESAAQESTGQEITDPVWIDSPHAPWASGFVPELAYRLNRSGEAKVRCTATAAGALTDCWVEKEAPPGLGFGEASLMLMQHARMKPLTASGAPVACLSYLSDGPIHRPGPSDPAVDGDAARIIDVHADDGQPALRRANQNLGGLDRHQRQHRDRGQSAHERATREALPAHARATHGGQARVSRGVSGCRANIGW